MCEFGNTRLEIAHHRIGDVFRMNDWFYLTIHPFSHQTCKSWRKIISTFFLTSQMVFYLLFGCRTANLRPLPRRQPYLTRFVDFTWVEGDRQPRNEVEPQSLVKYQVAFESANFSFSCNDLTELVFLRVSFLLVSSF